MVDEPMTAARVWDKLKSHEELCADRWQGIRDDVKDLRNAMSTASKIGLTVLIAMLGWMAVQVYDRISHPIYMSPPVAYAEPRR